MTKYEVSMGSDFAVNTVSVDTSAEIEILSNVSIAQRNARMRQRLTMLIVALIAIALTGSALIGLFDGTFNEVGIVWDASAFPLGFILRSYFDKG